MATLASTATTGTTTIPVPKDDTMSISPMVLLLIWALVGGSPISGRPFGTVPMTEWSLASSLHYTGRFM